MILRRKGCQLQQTNQQKCGWLQANKHALQQFFINAVKLNQLMKLAFSKHS